MKAGCDQLYKENKADIDGRHERLKYAQDEKCKLQQ